MNGNSTRRVAIEAAGDGVVAHVGLHALGALADRLGLGDALSARIPPAGERLPVHDRGKVLVQAMLMLAGGGESCADIEALRAQERLFGPVPSDSTTYRTFRQIDPVTLAGLWEAVAAVRAQVWRRSSVTNTAGPVVLDIDATLVEVHSENKEGTAPTYKRGFGFHPMLCFADATGEALAARLRPGNAGANTVADHLGVLDDAVAQLPAEVAAGHRSGDGAGEVVRPVVVRTDSAGCTHGFVAGCRDRNIGFAVVARSNRQVAAAISRTFTDPGPARWVPARRQDGEIRDGAGVAELTDLVDVSDWPPGTRLIVRREPLHPGAQQTLLPSTRFRYWGHWTDQAGDSVTLDATMRAHAHVEDHIRRLKDSGLCRFPLQRPRRQPGLAGHRLLRRRPGALVPAALPDRAPRPRRAQDAALAALARPRPPHPSRPPRHRPHPRRLARRARHPRGPHPHRRAHLTPAARAHPAIATRHQRAPTQPRPVPGRRPTDRRPTPSHPPDRNHATQPNEIAAPTVTEFS